MRTVVEDKNLVAKCGLYCGACPRYLKEKCDGCAANQKASWCSLRTCCMDKEIPSCADCSDFDDVMQCRKYNSLMAKIFGFIFNSDRQACIGRIRETGYDKFVHDMAASSKMTVRRR